MREDLAGINESGIDTLVLDIVEYVEKMNRLFGRLQELSAETKTYFDSAEGNQFREKMNSQLTFCQTVNQNILNYANDLTKVKGKYKTGEVNISSWVGKIN